MPTPLGRGCGPPQARRRQGQRRRARTAGPPRRGAGARRRPTIPSPAQHVGFLPRRGARRRSAPGAFPPGSLS